MLCSQALLACVGDLPFGVNPDIGEGGVDNERRGYWSHREYASLGAAHAGAPHSLFKEESKMV